MNNPANITNTADFNTSETAAAFTSPTADTSPAAEKEKTGFRAGDTAAALIS
ncbi:MAG: hypothetical protein GX827_03025, partial [Clostridiales bacterium]|nr:hypothetical protein [Clostridiales bacterium]